MDKPVLALVAFACIVAAGVWGRSARYLRKLQLRVESEFGRDSESAVLARAQFRKELHTTVLYVAVAVASLVVSFSDDANAVAVYALILAPIALSALWGRDFIREARLFE